MRSLFDADEVEKFPEAKKGTVEKTISPHEPGRVKCQGTYWPARFYESDCEATVLPGEPVSVVAMQGITLLVVPINTSTESASSDSESPENATAESSS